MCWDASSHFWCLWLSSLGDLQMALWLFLCSKKGFCRYFLISFPQCCCLGTQALYSLCHFSSWEMKRSSIQKALGDPAVSLTCVLRCWLTSRETRRYVFHRTRKSEVSPICGLIWLFWVKLVMYPLHSAHWKSDSPSQASHSTMSIEFWSTLDMEHIWKPRLFHLFGLTGYNIMIQPLFLRYPSW